MSYSQLPGYYMFLKAIKKVPLDDGRVAIWLAKPSWDIYEAIFILAGLDPYPPEDDPYEIFDESLVGTLREISDFMERSAGSYPEEVVVIGEDFNPYSQKMEPSIDYKPVPLLKWVEGKGLSIPAPITNALANLDEGGVHLLKAKEKRHYGILLKSKEKLPDYLKAAFCAGVYLAESDKDVLIGKNDLYQHLYERGCKDVPNEILAEIWKLLPSSRRRNPGRHPRKAKQP
ncbi:hypothetical protein [Geomonas subterranea]|uniref:hypothetical protein n=1 Tax=Geomonas subterranea TaxID=2847989 RepID=UPI001CD72631|nr:hypothetical protein [Geomonas fuzhouensis]